MKRLLLSASAAALVAIIGFSTAALGSAFGFWLLFRPLVIFHPLLPPSDESFFSGKAVGLSLLASVALYALLAHLAQSWRAARRRA